MKYHVIDANGYYVATHYSDKNIPATHSFVNYPEPPAPLIQKRIRWSGSVWVQEQLPDDPNPYIAQRAARYPRVQDQLDMLWHAMDDGTLPKVAGFYDAIKAVKDSVPKDVVVGPYAPGSNRMRGR